MNKKGNIGISIIVAITLFIAGMIFTNFITTEVSTARTTTALDCQNSSISDGNKMTCLAVDSVVPYYIILVFSAAGGFITRRLLI